jgi:hypothetical protein
MMTLLRFVAVLALAVWVGGLVTLGALTAPVLFTVLESQDALGGREMAGLLFGSVFREFQFLGWAMGGVLLTSLGLRAALGPRPQRMAIRMWTSVAMLAMSAVTTYVIIPGTPGPIAALAAADPVRVEFGRLHGISNVLALITVVGGIGLIWVELRDQH